MSFSQSFLEEIKYRNDITDVISHYVTLSRAGSNQHGLCPFHSEKTPSFVVFPQSSSFYCFGCGVGGDVVTFIMKIENVDYPSALEILAKRCGIPFEETQGAKREFTVKRERILKMNKEAARFFHSNLLSDACKPQLDYLKNRGLTNSTIKRFGLGAADSGWETVSRHLLSLGYNKEEIKAGFLAGEKNGRLYDYYRNRVIFPIIDLTGNVVAFGGRALGDEKPKYINSSDTPAFKKSRTLFALNFAKKYSADSGLLLCEGYMDVISLHQAGFPFAVATLGTAITGEHARLISQHTKNVYIAYDSDGAGKSATAKAINALNELGLNIKVIEFGDAKDPDEFIKKQGASAFKKRIEGSEGRIDYSLNEIIKKYDISLPDEKQRATDEACEYVANFRDKPVREIYGGRIAAILGLSVDGILKLIEKKASIKAKRKKREMAEADIRKNLGYGDIVNPDKLKFSEEASIEERILGILLMRPDLGKQALNELNENDFFTEFSKKVFLAIKPSLEEGKEILLSANEAFNEKEQAKLAGLMAQRLKFSKNDYEVLLPDIKLLKEKRKKRETDSMIEADITKLGDYFNELKIKKGKNN